MLYLLFLFLIFKNIQAAWDPFEDLLDVYQLFQDNQHIKRAIFADLGWSIATSTASSDVTIRAKCPNGEKAIGNEDSNDVIISSPAKKFSDMVTESNLQYENGEPASFFQATIVFSGYFVNDWKTNSPDQTIKVEFINSQSANSNNFADIGSGVVGNKVGDGSKCLPAEIDCGTTVCKQEIWFQTNIFASENLKIRISNLNTAFPQGVFYIRNYRVKAQKSLFKSCHSTCSACTGLTENDCTACPNANDYKHYPAGDISAATFQCVPDCYALNLYAVDDFDRNKDGGSEKICWICGKEVVNCVAGPDLCNTWGPIGYYKFVKDSKNVCLKQCPDVGYYETDEEECGTCHITCSECAGPTLSECTVCNTSLVLNTTEARLLQNRVLSYDLNSIEVYKPPKSYIPHDFPRNLQTVLKGRCECPTYEKVLSVQFDSYSCIPCNWKCVTCFGVSTYCLECGTNLDQIAPGFCQCLQGYYENTVDKEFCDPKCTRCTGGTNADCQVCIADAFLDEATSACLCKQSYYQDPTGGCQSLFDNNDRMLFKMSRLFICISMHYLHRNRDSKRWIL